MSKLDRDIYEFGRGLQLTIWHHGEDSIEFELKNRLYYQLRNEKFRQLFASLSFYVIYWFLYVIILEQRCLVVDAGLFFIVFSLILSTCRLIKREKLLYCTGFAIQMETERFLSSRSNVFISTPNIHDIRINEVIENSINWFLTVAYGPLFSPMPLTKQSVPKYSHQQLSITAWYPIMEIHYLLVVRTKNSLFKKKPIIPLFNNQRPSLECLELIYKRLSKRLRGPIL